MMKVMVPTDERRFAGKEGQREAYSHSKNNVSVNTVLERKSRHHCRPSTSGEVKRCVVTVRFLEGEHFIYLSKCLFHKCIKQLAYPLLFGPLVPHIRVTHFTYACVLV